MSGFVCEWMQLYGIDAHLHSSALSDAWYPAAGSDKEPPGGTHAAHAAPHHVLRGGGWRGGTGTRCWIAHSSAVCTAGWWQVGPTSGVRVKINREVSVDSVSAGFTWSLKVWGNGISFSRTWSLGKLMGMGILWSSERKGKSISLSVRNCFSQNWTVVCFLNRRAQSQRRHFLSVLNDRVCRPLAPVGVAPLHEMCRRVVCLRVASLCHIAKICEKFVNFEKIFLYQPWSVYSWSLMVCWQYVPGSVGLTVFRQIC